MADVRALLKAKRQEARITHPLASYTSAGQLRCVACGTAVKHASAWEGHVGSKAHRTNAARLRQEQARQAAAEEAEREREQQESLKRKATEMEVDEADDSVDAMGDDDADDGAHLKKRRVESGGPSAVAAAKNALPADFFSDPSMAPPPREDGDDDEEESPPAGAGAAAAPTAAGDALDLEWQKFQQSVINAPDYQDTYDRATVAAEPMLAEEIPQGFPGGEAGADGEEPAKEDVLDEEGLRRKREQEDRELIMDRLLEEEQAQEEADARVSALKTKLEALKQRREAAKAAKKGAK